MSTTTVKFEPTHEISYRSPPDAEPSVWFVALQDDNTAVDVNGRVVWRVNDLGQWRHKNLSLRGWPDAKLSVVNLHKPKKIKKGQEPKHMPAGTLLTLTRQDDGSWQGRCEFNGVACQRESKGLMGLISALCRAWLKARALLKEAGITTVKPSEAEDG